MPSFLLYNFFLIYMFSLSKRLFATLKNLSKNREQCFLRILTYKSKKVCKAKMMANWPNFSFNFGTTNQKGRNSSQKVCLIYMALFNGLLDCQPLLVNHELASQKIPS